MMKKNVIWHKVKNRLYLRNEYNDESMATLSLFLEDGLGFKTYVDFLENEQQEKFTGNMSIMRKNGKMITISINEYIFPDMPLFTTTIKNMITIFKEFQRLENLGVDWMEISLDNDILMITGDSIN